MAYYSKRHYQRLTNGGPDTPERIAERTQYRTAATLALAEREQRYPVLTTENAREAIAYQDERIAYHRARLASEGA